MAKVCEDIVIKLDPDVMATLDRIAAAFEGDKLKRLMELLERIDAQTATVPGEMKSENS